VVAGLIKDGVMAIQFIFGTSGTGKTHHCMEAMVSALQGDDAGPLIFLVPEQATYQAERAVISHAGVDGYNRLSILSFDRLNFQLTGRNTARARLSALGRQMVLYRLLHEVADQLTVYRASSSHAGFVGQALHILDQLNGAAVGPDELARCIDRLETEAHGGLLTAKLRDIQVLLTAYIRFIEGRFVDPDQQSQAARQAVPQHELLSGARLWVDGFAGFTQAELLMLRALMQTVSHTSMALCLDPESLDRVDRDPDPLDLFAPTLATYRQLLSLIGEINLTPEQPVILSEAHRFSSAPALAHVERSLFKPDVTCMPVDGRIMCVSAADVRSEVQFVARTIQRLVREQGVRDRDIAVVASDLGAYEHLIHAYFDEYGLPFFLDRQQPLTHHPGATLVSSAIRLAMGPFEPSEVMAYVRSDLLGLDRRDLDQLENYCLALGVGSRDWHSTEPWAFDDPSEPRFDERAVNRTRNLVARPLRQLRDALTCETVTGDTFVQAVQVFLEDLKVARTLEVLIKRADHEGDPARADRHRQFWDWLTGVLDECRLVLGEYQAPAAFFARVLTAAFSQMTLALIPPTLDQILVGAIERSRHPEVKVVFLVGTTQKQFPGALRSDSLLSDADRDMAALAGLDLPGSMTESLSQRRYLAYIAFTRASRQLIVTYPQTDDKGHVVVRSQFIRDLESLFSDLHEQRVTEEDESSILSTHDLADRLCAQRIGDWTPWQDILPDAFGTLSQAVTPKDHSLNQLDPAVSASLFGPIFHTSATRLGTYAACPFQYFARYVLGLEPRREFGLEPLDKGNFYHRVLELFVQAMIKARADWTHLTSDSIKRGVDKMIDQVRQESAFIRNFEAHSPVNAYILQCACDVLHEAVPELVQAMVAGRFRPVLTEAEFGSEQALLGEFTLALAQGRQVSLHGKVDRIDLTGHGEEGRAVVFDYKSTDRSPDWTGMWHGLDLQLLVYVLALRHARAAGKVKARSAGAFFVPIESTGRKQTLSTSSDKLAGFKRKAKGLFDVGITADLDPIEKGDSQYFNFFVTTSGEALGHYNTRGAMETERFDKLLEFGSRKLRDLSEAILAGHMPVSPYRRGTATPCTFCDFRALCRFDWQTHTCRTLESTTKTDVLAALEAEDS
jgi:ATP-dependent helicase/nuclease subunit B